jgi:ribosomal protein S11
MILLQGSEGFKNARRGTNFAGQQAAIAAAKVIHMFSKYNSV